jgi:hypothetical protein
MQGRRAIPPKWSAVVSRACSGSFRLSHDNLSYEDLLRIVELIKTSEQFSEFRLKVGEIEQRRRTASDPPKAVIDGRPPLRESASSPAPSAIAHRRRTECASSSRAGTSTRDTNLARGLDCRPRADAGDDLSGTGARRPSIHRPGPARGARHDRLHHRSDEAQEFDSCRRERDGDGYPSG